MCKPQLLFFIIISISKEECQRKKIQDQIIFQNKNPGSRKGRKRYFADNYMVLCEKSIYFFQLNKRKNCKI